MIDGSILTEDKFFGLPPPNCRPKVEAALEILET